MEKDKSENFHETTIATLTFVFNIQEQILLCMKKKTNSGFTASLNKRNGAGGKVDPGETILQAAQRELQEETGVQVSIDQLEKVGLLHFHSQIKNLNRDVHVFAVYNYTGDFQETEEMRPQRRDTTQIPYDQMREDDKYRLPRVLQGQYIEYHFYFDNNQKLEIKKIQQIQ